MADEVKRYNKICPGHPELGRWADISYMREDDLVCTSCYKRLPKKYRLLLWRIKKGIDAPSDMSNLSIVVDWLLEHPEPEDARWD